MPRDEGVPADEGHQQLQHRGALGVGDAVEVLLHLLQVAHVRGDRVGGGQLVLQVGPALALVGERRPRVRVGAVLARDLVGGEVGGPLGEGLVEPQVVPPAHGDQVAEPHVGQLVEDRVVARLHLAGGHPGAEDVLVPEVTQPAFSIAPQLNSGTKTWSYVSKAYGTPKAASKTAKPRWVVSGWSVRVEVLRHRRPAGDAPRGSTPFADGDLRP